MTLKESKPKKKHKHKHKHKGKQTPGISAMKGFKENKDISDSSSHKENIEQNDVNEGSNNDAKSGEADAKEVEVKRETFGESRSNVEVKIDLQAAKPISEHSSEAVKSEIQEVPPLKIKLPITKKDSAENIPLDTGNDSETSVKSGDSISKPDVCPVVSEAEPPVSSSNGSLAAPSPSPLAVVSTDPVIQYPGLVYRPGSFILQGLPQGQQVVSSWGLPVLAHTMPTTLQPGKTPSQGNSGLNDTKNLTLPNTPTGRPRVDQSLGVNSAGVPQGLTSLGSVVNNHLNSSSHHKPPISAHCHPKHQVSNSTLKAAHNNAPRTPAPYLLEDHIQPTKETVPTPRVSAMVYPSQSSRYPHPNDLLGHTSHTLAPIMHPTPPGHKCHLSLPPAPSSIFLNPSSTNPFAPLPQPTNDSPPTAHIQLRKRPYPFDNLNVTAPAPQNVFPSPDMVLNRIKNSTGVPRSNSSASRPISTRQSYEDPREIFRQSAKPFTATSQNVATAPPRKSSQLVQEKPNHRLLANQKPSKASPSTSMLSSSSLSSSQSKQKNTQPTNSQLYIPYGALPPGQNIGSLQVQKSLHQQVYASTSTNNLSNKQQHSNNKHIDAHKNTINNGILQVPQQVSKIMPSQISSHQPPQITSVGKDGRLTSALFGAQFSALPRTTNASEKIPVPVTLEASQNVATAAMSLNPHLHPAFMSPYLPTASPTATAQINPQLQMLAGAYGATPVQLAAYEELLRQNGYGAFLQGAAPPSAKAAKKN